MTAGPEGGGAVGLRALVDGATRLLDEAGVGRLDLDMWTMSERPPSPKIALALKSGNFGGREFFTKAFTVLA